MVEYVKYKKEEIKSGYDTLPEFQRIIFASSMNVFPAFSILLWVHMIQYQGWNFLTISQGVLLVVLSINYYYCLTKLIGDSTRQNVKK